MKVRVTGEEVKRAMTAAGIVRVEHHACGFCGYETAYLREGEQLFFDPGCDCTRGAPWEERSWDDAADWMNMQTNPESLAELRRRFGLPPTHGG